MPAKRGAAPSIPCGKEADRPAGSLYFTEEQRMPTMARIGRRPQVSYSAVPSQQADSKAYGADKSQRGPTEANRADGRRRLVQAELRGITGTHIKDEADRERRMLLWRELDRLVAERDGVAE
jgi:hypothetical protein